MKKAAGKRARRKLLLLDFNFDLVHGAGVKYQAADVQLRPKTGGRDTKMLEDEISVMDIFDQGQTLNGGLKQDYDEEYYIMNAKIPTRHAPTYPRSQSQQKTTRNTHKHLNNSWKCSIWTPNVSKL